MSAANHPSSSAPTFFDPSRDRSRVARLAIGCALCAALWLLVASPSLAKRTAPQFGHPACEADAVRTLDADGGAELVASGETTCFRLYLPSSGLWLVGADGAELSVYPAGCESASDDLSITRRAAHELLVGVGAPGDHVVCAVPTAGNTAPIRVTSRFEQASKAAEGAPLAEGLRAARAVGGRDQVAALCVDSLDDHGGTLTCASPLQLRYTTDLRTKQEPDPNCSEPDPDPSCKRLGALVATLTQQPGGDVDVFTFDVGQWSSLRVQATSEVGRVEVGLLDRHGQPLAGSLSSGVHLGPGSYALRVAGDERAEGTYSLKVSVDEAP